MNNLSSLSSNHGTKKKFRECLCCHWKNFKFPVISEYKWYWKELE